MPGSRRRCGGASSRLSARRARRRGPGSWRGCAPGCRRPAPGRWALAGGVAALVLAAFVAGRFWPASPAGTVGPSQAARDTGEALRERVLLSALGDHFDRTEAMLVELAGTAPGERVSIAAEQRRAGDLLAATRLYRRAAVDAGDANVADVLELAAAHPRRGHGQPVGALGLRAPGPAAPHREAGAALQTAHRVVRGAESRAVARAGRATRSSPAPDQTGHRDHEAAGTHHRTRVDARRRRPVRRQRRRFRSARASPPSTTASSRARTSCTNRPGRPSTRSSGGAPSTRSSTSSR